MLKVILALVALSSTLFVNLLAISEVTWGLIISGITTVLTGLIGLFAAKINRKVDKVATETTEVKQKVAAVAVEIDGKMEKQEVLIKSLAKAEQKIESDAEHKIEVKEIVKDAKTQSDLKDARAEIPPTKQASSGKEHQLGATKDPEPVVIQTASLQIGKADIKHEKAEPPTEEKKE